MFISIAYIYYIKLKRKRKNIEKIFAKISLIFNSSDHLNQKILFMLKWLDFKKY